MKFNPVLHPKCKMKYFKKNWSEALQKEVISMAENIVRPFILIFLLILTKVVSLQNVMKICIRETLRQWTLVPNQCRTVIPTWAMTIWMTPTRQNLGSRNFSAISTPMMLSPREQQLWSGGVCVTYDRYFFNLLTNFILLVKLRPLSGVGLPRPWLPLYHGIVCVKREGIFISWDYVEQAP